MRTVPFIRHSAVLHFLRDKDAIDVESDEDNILGVSIEQLTTAMSEHGNNWERVPLRHSEGREGWEDALIGCLKDVSYIGPKNFSASLMSLYSSMLHQTTSPT